MLAPCLESIELLVAVSILGGTLAELSGCDGGDLFYAVDRFAPTWAFGEAESWPALRELLGPDVIRVSLDSIEPGAVDYEAMVACGRKPGLELCAEGAIGPVLRVEPGEDLLSTAMTALSVGGTVVLPAHAFAAV